jgi:hypothetical protein
MPGGHYVRRFPSRRQSLLATTRSRTSPGGESGGRGCSRPGRYTPQAETPRLLVGDQLGRDRGAGVGHDNEYALWSSWSGKPVPFWGRCCWRTNTSIPGQSPRGRFRAAEKLEEGQRVVSRR